MKDFTIAPDNDSCFLLLKLELSLLDHLFVGLIQSILPEYFIKYFWISSMMLHQYYLKIDKIWNLLDLINTKIS